MTLSGCGGILGGGPIAIGDETANGNQHVYVVSNDGELPAGTEITWTVRMSNGRTSRDITDGSTTLDQAVSEGTKVYIAGMDDGDLSVSVGERADGRLPQMPVTAGGAVDKVITVDTGNTTVEKNVEFEGES